MKVDFSVLKSHPHQIVYKILGFVDQIVASCCFDPNCSFKRNKSFHFIL